ncbi:hypothetical protein [uncultured Sulfitobacter sp.]|uniref:hypothetical protein n=1 Tax=uncultured Sulfitobacter sp. TaxID=191468 RepID=UPI002605001A|nr:hypothetical protein [uncultured Sulfitobacter sp.]
MRFLSLLSLLTCFATNLWAAPPTVEELRSAIKNRDVTQTNALLNTAQEAFLDCTLTAEDIRARYRPFITSDPDTVSFVEDWLAAEPDNPKAQIARGWSLWNGAWAIGRAPNSYSSYIASEMRGMARDLFTSSYKADNALTPTSDAAVRGYTRASFGVPDAYNSLIRTLQKHPNWGSVKRFTAINNFASEQSGRDHCAKIATYFALDQAAVMENRCLMQVGTEMPFEGLHAYIEEHFWRDNDPETTLFRLDYLLRWSDRHKLSKRHIEWAKDVVLYQPFNQYDLDDLPHMVHHLNLAMYIMEDIPAQDLMAEFRKTRLPEAEAFLKHDPHSLAMMEMIEGVAFASEMTYTKRKTGDNKTSMSSTVVRVERTPAEEDAFKAAKAAQRKDFALRRLGASPYHPELWYEYGYQANLSNPPYSTFSGDAALHNSVLFSDDPARYLQYILNHKRQEFWTVRALSELDLSEALPENLEEFTNRVAWANQTDIYGQIVCPYTRAERLYDAVCREYPAGAMQCDRNTMPTYDHTDELEELAKTAPACAEIRDSALEDLWYEPTPFKDAIVQTQ